MNKIIKKLTTIHQSIDDFHHSLFKIFLLLIRNFTKIYVMIEVLKMTQFSACKNQRICISQYQQGFSLNLMMLVKFFILHHIHMLFLNLDDWEIPIFFFSTGSSTISSRN